MRLDQTPSAAVEPRARRSLWNSVSCAKLCGLLVLASLYAAPGCDTACPTDPPMRPTDPKVLAAGGYRAYQKAMDIYRRGLWSEELSEEYNRRMLDLRRQGEELEQGMIGLNAVSQQLTMQSLMNYSGGANNRRKQGAVLDPMRGGALIIGGYSEALNRVVGRSFLFDGGTEEWRRLGDLNTPREQHTATLLRDDRVLVVGGTDFEGAIFDSAETLDPQSGEWSLVDSMLEPHIAHSANLLPDGRVIVVGGVNTSDGAVEFEDRLAGVEFFVPEMNAFMPGPEMNARRTGHRGVTLIDGRVLIVGGFSDPPVASTAELYDPDTNSFSPTANTMSVDHGEGLTATLLEDGRVLVAGGTSSDDVAGLLVPANTDIFDPATDSFTPGPDMRTARQGHQAVLLPDGKVLVMGGQTQVMHDDDSVEWVDLDTSEVYNPATNTFTPSDTKMSVPRYQFTAVLVP